MLNQTFSLANFEDIYDEDNRRGRNRDAEYFPSVVSASRLLSAKSRALRAFRRRYAHLNSYPVHVQRRHDVLVRNLARHKERRESAIREALEAVSEEVNAKSFRIALTQFSARGKSTYTAQDNAPNYYALRQINRNIRQLYKVKPANRNEIISQLSILLRDGYQYNVIRTDLQSFFESIDHEELVKKLDKDQLLSAKSINIIKQILWNYSNFTGTTGKGVPRGLAISSDLAELYMRPVDRDISALEGVVYYGRFVDDIVILAVTTQQKPAKALFGGVKSIIAASGLTMNSSKTHEFNQAENWRLKYLGYQFKPVGSRVSIDITQEKKLKSERRVNLAFDAYEKQRHKHPKRAYRLLLKRVAFLTGNTRLSNNKGNALVGNYYSSLHLDDYTSIRALDGKLRQRISQISSATLKAKLRNYTFEDGHKQRTFHKFNRKRTPDLGNEFESIVRAWKNAD